MKNPEKFSVTGIGFQATNGKSLIDFPKSSKTYNIIDFLVKIRIKNTNKKYIKEKLESVVNNFNLDEFYLKRFLEDDFHDKIEFKNIVDEFFAQKNLNIEQIKKKMRIILENENKKNQRKIDRLQRENILKNLNKIKIKAKLKKEIQITVILDNYPVHKAQLVKKTCEILNIKLVPLPPYSPKLNPIEQVWRTIKKQLSKVYIADEKFLIKEFNKIYQKIIENKTFYNKWVEKFIK